MLSKLIVIVCVFATLASCKTISQVAEEILEVDKDILQEIRRHSDVRDPDGWRTVQRAAGDSRRSDAVSDIFLKDEQEALADYETIIEILRKPRIPHTRRVSIIYQLISVRCCALLYSKFSICCNTVLLLSNCVYSAMLQTGFHLGPSNDFQWKSCGAPSDLVSFSSLALKPDPLTFPGNITFSGQGQIKSDLTSPISVSVHV